MTVEDLIEELKLMPPTAMVFVLAPLIDRREYDDFVNKSIESLVYDMAQVSIKVEE